MPNRTCTTAAVLVASLLLAVHCAASPPVPATPPELHVLILDTSDSSPVTTEKAVTAAQVLVDSAIDGGAQFQIWTTGATLEECRLVWDLQTVPVETGTKRVRVVKRQQQLEAAGTAARAITTGALAIRPRTSLLFETLAKVVRAKPPGTILHVAFITDMKEATKGFSMECRVPSAADLAAYLQANGLLQPDPASKDIATLAFAYVDLSTASPQCPGATLKDQARLEELWRSALTHSGIAPAAIEVLAGPPRPTRRASRRPRAGRKKSLLARFTGIRLPTFTDHTGAVISLSNLPAPKELGISLHDYVISLIGPCPKHNPEEDPRLARAAQDALLTSEVEAEQRVVDARKEELAAYPPAWLLVLLILLFVAAEVWATQALLEELGIHGLTSWLWALGQVAALIWFLELLAHKVKSRIAYLAGYALVIAVVVAMAMLRSGDLGDGTQETGIVDQVTQTLLLSAVVCGIPFLLSAALGAYNARGPIARKLRNEQAVLADLDTRQAAGQTAIEDSYAAVQEWHALAEQVRAEALVQYPNYFHDAPAHDPTTLGAPAGSKEESHDGDL